MANKHTTERAGAVPKHLRFMRDGPISMRNGKPYRTPANKILAKKQAKKTKFGNFSCNVRVEFHK